MCGPFGPLALAVVGADAADFEIADDACGGKTLTYHEDCVAAILFKPTTAGAKTAQLQVAAGGQVALSVYLSGMGL